MPTNPKAKTVAAILYWAWIYIKGNFGYSQPKRWTGASGSPGDFDCTSIIGVILWRAGFLTRSDISGAWASGNGSASSPIPKKLKAKGWRVVSASGKSLAWLRKTVTAGAVLIGPGHAVLGLGGGKILSWEFSEKAAIKGKIGRQKGERVGVRNLYLRSRGWKTLCLPPASKPVTALSSRQWPAARLGSTGRWVKMLQKAMVKKWPAACLKAARAHGARRFVVDGQCGPITCDAIRIVEGAKKRHVTGAASPWLWASLGLSSVSRIVKTPIV